VIVTGEYEGRRSRKERGRSGMEEGEMDGVEEWSMGM
jgi:hypothetical protein